MVRAEFSFSPLRYGWTVLTGVDTNTDSIYSATNTRQFVQQVDIIPLVLGTYERCLATQYASNPPAYYVAPLNHTVGWITTNNSGGYITNSVTNSFNWFIDDGVTMLYPLDDKIKALVPYFVNTNFNTMYDNSTNADVVMLTVTGLWDELEIGDHTNKFTLVPSWTNTVQTNYHVCYTSYWPTNTTPFPHTNSYTSSYNQVVNFGQSWTATGGVVWASMSNWPTTVSQTTNEATYGSSYDWHIYTRCLEERYKVLNALRQYKMPAPNMNRLWARWAVFTDQANWANARADSEARFWATQFVGYAIQQEGFTWGTFEASYYVPGLYHLSISRMTGTVWWAYSGSNLTGTGKIFMKPSNRNNYAPVIYEHNGMLMVSNTVWKEQVNSELSFNAPMSEIRFQWPASGDLPVPMDEPTAQDTYRGYEIESGNIRCLVNWDFKYCTNKYW
jgi:hypothetical protein